MGIPDAPERSDEMRTIVGQRKWVILAVVLVIVALAAAAYALSLLVDYGSDMKNDDALRMFMS